MMSSSQKAPWKPGRQSQKAAWTPSVQEPPLWHGSGVGGQENRLRGGRAGPKVAPRGRGAPGNRPGGVGRAGHRAVLLRSLLEPPGSTPLGPRQAREMLRQQLPPPSTNPAPSRLCLPGLGGVASRGVTTGTARAPCTQPRSPLFSRSLPSPRGAGGLATHSAGSRRCPSRSCAPCSPPGSGSGSRRWCSGRRRRGGTGSSRTH